MSEVKQKVISILSDKLGIEETEIHSESNLVNDLGMDSLDHVEITMELEKEYNIAIMDEDAEAWKVINDVVQKVESLIAEG